MHTRNNTTQPPPPPPLFEKGAYCLVDTLVCHLAACAMCNLKTLMGMVLLMSRWSLLLFRSVLQRATQAILMSLKLFGKMRILSYLHTCLDQIWIYSVIRRRWMSAFSRHFCIVIINSIIYLILLTGKILPPFYFCPFHPKTQGLIWIWIPYKGLCKKIRDWANSLLDESVSHLSLYVKIRLGYYSKLYTVSWGVETLCDITERRWVSASVDCPYWILNPKLTRTRNRYSSHLPGICLMKSYYMHLTKYFKADMKKLYTTGNGSHIFSREPFSKTGYTISLEYVMVDFICMGLLNLFGMRTKITKW